MKVLLINGSPHREGCTYTALKEIQDTLRDSGIDSEIFWIGQKPIHGCVACGGCSVKGACVIDDGVNRVHERLGEFGGIVIGSPVYFGGITGQLKCFLDRLFYSAGDALCGKAAAAVVSCRRGGASMAFQSLNMFFGLSNMNMIGSQYWNQVHGLTPEEVKEDREGMQTMRTLAKNMAWQMKNTAAGAKAGIMPPVYEDRENTNFIR